MTRHILVGGVLAATFGVALFPPAITEYLERGFLAGPGIIVVLVGFVLILSGGTVIRLGLRRRKDAALPAPVRATITGIVLFLAFCALEVSDGLIRQGGRVFYWTSVLFLPALLLLYGLLSARSWAWWTARSGTALFTLWFAGFIAVIPFADLQNSEGPFPWWGRAWMMGVSLVFASISAYAFRSLGRPDARKFYGM